MLLSPSEFAWGQLPLRSSYSLYLLLRHSLHYKVALKSLSLASLYIRPWRNDEDLVRKEFLRFHHDSSQNLRCSFRRDQSKHAGTNQTGITPSGGSHISARLWLHACLPHLPSVRVHKLLHKGLVGTPRLHCAFPLRGACLDGRMPA